MTRSFTIDLSMVERPGVGLTKKVNDGFRQLGIKVEEVNAPRLGRNYTAGHGRWVFNPKEGKLYFAPRKVNEINQIMKDVFEHFGHYIIQSRESRQHGGYLPPLRKIEYCESNHPAAVAYVEQNFVNVI